MQLRSSKVTMMPSQQWMRLFYPVVRMPMHFGVLHGSIGRTGSVLVAATSSNGVVRTWQSSDPYA